MLFFSFFFQQFNTYLSLSLSISLSYTHYLSFHLTLLISIFSFCFSPARLFISLFLSHSCYPSLSQISNHFLDFRLIFLFLSFVSFPPSLSCLSLSLSFSFLSSIYLPHSLSSLSLTLNKFRSRVSRYPLFFQFSPSCTSYGPILTTQSSILRLASVFLVQIAINGNDHRIEGKAMGDQ